MCVYTLCHAHNAKWKHFTKNFKLQISLIHPTNNSQAFIATQKSIETFHRLRNEMQRDSDGKMEKWESDCKWSTDCESECNVCEIISLIEFSKAIVLVVTLLSAYAHIDAVKLFIYENIIKCVGKCWMRCECKYLGFVSLKTLRMYLWSSGSELKIGTHLSILFFSPFEHSSSGSSCRTFTIILSCVHNYLRFCGRVALLPLCQWTMGRATQHAHAYTHTHASIHRMNGIFTHMWCTRMWAKRKTTTVFYLCRFERRERRA